MRTYTCTDAEDNAVSMERKFTVVDEDVPVIKLMGDDAEEWNASLTKEYTDKGAMCTDHVDGVLSNAVEVSGNVVNMRIPGTYTIKYVVTDSVGNTNAGDNNCKQVAGGPAAAQPGFHS